MENKDPQVIQDPPEQLSTYTENPEKETHEKDALWEEQGFHRPLAGFWYDIMFAIFHILIGSVVGVILYPLMFPFPECIGYYDTATGVFVAIFVAFDLGTSNMMNRFVGANAHNPEKLVQYLQYFIWYQMFSGLIQVTGISIWALYATPTDLQYFMWIFLLYSTVQYPAMQGVFRSTLEALQYFNKSSILGFVGGDVIQKSLEIVFALLFRFTLGQNPQFKVLLAVSIGLVFGKYLDDFITMGIGMKYFNDSMKNLGIHVSDCFRHDFSFKLARKTFVYGVKTGFPDAISSFFGLLVLSWWLTVPQYTSFVALYSIARSLVNFINGIQFKLGGAISETYLNDKTHLCRYYIGETIRYSALVQIMLYMIFLIVSLILEDFFIRNNMFEYALSIPFMYTTLIRRFTIPYENLAKNILVSTNHPNIAFIISMVQMVMNVLVWYLVLVVFRLPHHGGITMMIWLLPCGDLVVAVLGMIITYIYIHKKIISLKIAWWSSFGAPLISAMVCFILGNALFDIVYQSLVETITFVPTLILLGGIFFAIFPFFIYFPLTVLLGGWDDYTIKTFEKSRNIAGPAKWLVTIILKRMKSVIPHAKLHNRSNPPIELIEADIQALMKLKQNTA